MTAPLLELTGIRAGYGDLQALFDISLEVRAGEIVTLIGANGAGKTTLLMTICGKPRAAQGRIALDGADITTLPTFAIVRRGLAAGTSPRCTRSSPASRSAARTWATSSPAASSRCWRSPGR